MKTKIFNTIVSLMILGFISIGNVVSAQHHQPNHPPKGLPRANMPVKQPSMMQAQKVLKLTNVFVLKVNEVAN